MDFRILNTDFQQIDTVDQYESIIWTIRFVESGDFELYTPVNERLLENVKVGYYLFSDEFYDEVTNRANLMIIETIEITSDPESSNKIKITGRDLKSILDRRIVWGQRAFTTTDNVKTVVEALLNENAITPADWSKEYQSGDGGTIKIEVPGSLRVLPNLVIESTTEELPSIDGDYQYNGETLYDVFVEIGNRFSVGFEILYDFNTGKFVFHQLTTKDHTYDQTANNPLIFSPSFENLKNSNYIESSSTEKNAGLIVGEGDENNVMYNVIGNEYSGLNRRELNISASDISRVSEEGRYVKAYPTGNENPSQLHWYEKVNAGYVLSTDTTVDPSKTYYIYATEFGNKTYLSMLLEKGENELALNTYTQTYEGEAEPTRGYVYLQDYNVGDICEIINEWGIGSKVLIDEVVLSISTSSISIIPTFAAVDNGSNKEVNT